MIFLADYCLSIGSELLSQGYPAMSQQRKGNNLKKQQPDQAALDSDITG